MEDLAECGRGNGHAVFVVTVRNEHTGEMVSLRARGMSPKDAQEQALLHLFDARGLRKATAFSPGPAINS